MTPIAESKQDLTVLMESDIHLTTSVSSGLLEKRSVKHVPHWFHQRQIGTRNDGAFTGGDRSFLGHNYLPNEFQQVANYGHKMFCGTYSRDGDVFLSASQGLTSWCPEPIYILIFSRLPYRSRNSRLRHVQRPFRIKILDPGPGCGLGHSRHSIQP